MMIPIHFLHVLLDSLYLGRGTLLITVHIFFDHEQSVLDCLPVTGVRL